MAKKKTIGKHSQGAIAANKQTTSNGAKQMADEHVQDIPEGEQAALSDSPTQALGAQETVALPTAQTQAIPVQSDAQPTIAMTPAANAPAQDDVEDPLAGFDVKAGGAPLEPTPVPVMSYEAAKLPDIPQKKDRRGMKAFIITFVVLACVLAAVYTGIALMFSGQFMPNTRIAGLDISMKQDDEVIEMLDTIPSNYTLDIVGDKFSMRATGDEIGMKIDSQAIVDAMHEDQSPWRWPWYVTETNHDETFLLTTSFDKKACNKLVKDAVKKFNKKAEPPTDASIYFDEDAGKYAVKSEEVGTQLDAKAVQKVARDAAANMDEKAEVGEEQLLQPSLLSTDKKLVDTVDMANGLISAHLTLKINGNPVDEIGSDLLKGFVKISDKYEVTLSEDELSTWVNQLAASYNTIGMERTYTRADGKTITVSGGSYGWEVDQASLSASIMDAIKSGETTEIEIPCIDSANTYAGRGQRDWGNRYIDVDISEQHVRFYGDDGKIIWEADCISGAPDGEHDTVQGVWYVVAKESPSTLIGYQGKKKEYETEVEYWMPFEGNSIGFHDATWQPDFGGSMYADGYGSHGCVNLSYSDAESLYGIIQPGDVVVVHS